MNTRLTVPLPGPATPPDAAELSNTASFADTAATLPLGESILPSSEGSDPLAEAPTTASAPPPRTRWAAIVWGLCFAAIAWFGIWMLSDRERHDSVTDWLASLNPGTITAFALLTLGALVLISGLVGLIRHAQRRLARAA